MEARLRKSWDTLRSSYWFVPVVMTLCVVVLWLGTSAVDRFIIASGAFPVSWLYADEPESVRTLILALAGAIIGIVGVVFSVTMIPLTIAASQFGPRLLRTFLRDTGTQITIGTFIATFIFCMLVLLLLPLEPRQPIPQCSVTCALLLALICLGVLIYFINHVATSIQAPMVAAEVSAELLATIDRELPRACETPAFTAFNSGALANLTEKAQPIPAHSSGYVQARDDEGLLQLATEHKSVIQLLYQPGDFVVQNTPLALISPASAPLAEVESAINAAFLLGHQRTLVQDVTFGVNELVEMAVRALSPAINDPFTAMTCLDWIGTALCQAASRTFPAPVRYDKEGEVRLLTKALSFADLTDAAFQQIREYGRTSTLVMLRMLHTIEVVAHCATSEEQRAALLRHATLVEEAAANGLPQAADHQAVTTRFGEVVLALRTDRANLQSAIT